MTRWRTRCRRSWRTWRTGPRPATCAAGRLDGAIAAARAGLRVEPASGVLWDDLVRAIRERDGEAAANRALADRAVAINPPATDPRGIPARLTA